MSDEDMCDNCVTPWKCNGPHCWCGTNGGEGCYCCTDDCPDDCMADHKGGAVSDLARFLFDRQADSYDSDPAMREPAWADPDMGRRGAGDTGVPRMNEHTAENDAPPWRCVNPRCALCASVIPPVKGDIA